ncbi:MAG TPA: S53 family peptidase, partial [Terracidiphilus sp.]
MVTVAQHTPSKVLDGTALRVSHYNPEQKLRLVLTVQPPHMAEEEQFIKELTTKGSPNFHKFLTLEQWNARFAPSVEDEQAVVDWAQSVGLTVTKRYSDRLIVNVEGTAGTIEKAFGVTINNYQVGDEVDFSNDRDPVIPANLNGILSFVTGLSNIERPHRIGSASKTVKGADYVPGPEISEAGNLHGDGDPTKAPWARPTAMTSRAAAKAAKNESGSPTKPNANDNYPLDYMSGTYAMDPDNVQSSNGYDYNALQKLSYCCNQPGDSGGSPPESSIALVGYGGFLVSDVSTFDGKYGMAYNLTWYCIGGGSCPGNDGEAPLDVEYSGAMSNSYGSYLNTAHIYEYEMTNNLYTTYEAAFNDIVSDGHAKVVSTSYGWEENVGFSGSVATGTMHPIFNTMVGTGITLIAASGDNGASDGCGDATAVDYPSSDPDFIAAGGTQLNMYTDGIFYSETAWQGESWSGACGSNHGGSTGGVSVLFAAPGWQSSVVSPFYLWKGGSEYVETGNTNRMVPDISLTANPDVLGQWYVSGGSWGDEGGTSIVAPELAGFFAQENSYLDYIGDACGGSGTSACSPVGNAAPFLYYNAIDGAPHNPFYDMLSGCSNNDVTAYYNLFYYCAYAGYDPITGWGSANMMQLAWGINWEIIPADGAPSLTFGGPTINTWYNTDQIVDWDLTDGSSNGYTPPGPAGFTLGWDTIPSDSHSEPHGGDGDTFYTGPEYTYSTFGCVDNNGTYCEAASGQGCHTVYVRGWDNQGNTTNGSYGPVCFDSVPPTITVSNSPATPASGWWNSSVVVTLNPTDPGGSNASGIYRTYYAINTGSCYPGNLGPCTIYTGPFTMSGQQQSYIYYFTEDNAGNFSSEPYEWVSIDLTKPVTTASLSGYLVSGTYYSAVQVTLAATDSGGSGVAATYYQLDGGGTTTYTGVFTVSALGGHSVKYWSVDNAGNIETAKTKTFTIASTVPAALTTPAPGSELAGTTATFTWSAGAGITLYQLELGTTGVGSLNVYNSGGTTATTETVSGIPANGATLYARLFWEINGVWHHADYTYTEAPSSAPPALVTPIPGSVLTGSTVAFTWTASVGVTSYQLDLGTTGVGSSNLYNSGGTTATTKAVSGLPTNGVTVFARLYSEINGFWQSADYTYTESGTPVLPVLTTPAPGSVLSGSSVAFTRTAGGGPASYQLWLGTTGVGSQNLYNSGATTATTVTVNNLPTNGVTVYARFWWEIGGAWNSADYTYTEAGTPVLPVLTTPAPGSVLSGSSVAFTWTAGAGPAAYQLYVGTTGVGTHNLYESGATTATTVTVSDLPTTGVTV